MKREKERNDSIKWKREKIGMKSNQSFFNIVYIDIAHHLLYGAFVGEILQTIKATLTHTHTRTPHTDVHAETGDAMYATFM